MRKNAGLTIYFSCTNCKLVYQTTQVHVIEPTNGRHDCVECRKRVHSWTGLYDFLHWKASDTQRLNPRAPSRSPHEPLARSIGLVGTASGAWIRRLALAI
jgi:hypothetical protein